MGSDTESSTSPTLLSRVRRAPTDQEAWADFVNRYGKMIHAWCRQWGLQHADADDVTQNVLVDLSQQIANFQYDVTGRFRGWLKTIAYRAWCDYFGRRKGELGSGDSRVLAMLNSVEARESFLSHLESEWDRELLSQAMQTVRHRVQDHTWEVFRLMTQEGLSGPDVADRLKMNVGAVWVAKSKVQRMIQDEIRRLDTLDAGGPG